MKVIRHGAGWDITFDVIFADKQTADAIAKRIAPLLPTLIRDAVADLEKVAEGQPTRSYDTADGNTAEEDCASTCPTFVSRVRRLGISPFAPVK